MIGDRRLWKSLCSIIGFSLVSSSHNSLQNNFLTSDPHTHSLWEIKLLYIAILCKCFTSQIMRLLSEYIQVTLLEVASNLMASVSGYTAVSLMDSSCWTVTKLDKSTPRGCGLGSIPQYRRVPGSNNLFWLWTSSPNQLNILWSNHPYLTIPLSQAHTIYLLLMSMEKAVLTWELISKSGWILCFRKRWVVPANQPICPRLVLL